MDWLKRIRPAGPASSKSERSSAVPEGLWKKCPKCASPLYRPELERNLDVCPKCEHHMRIGARRRLDIFLDQQGRVEIAEDIEAIDRLKFKDVKKYRDRLTEARKKTGEKDALVAISGNLKAIPVVACALNLPFTAVPWVMRWVRSLPALLALLWSNSAHLSVFLPPVERACKRR